MKSRNNKQIWRLARYLYESFDYDYDHMNDFWNSSYADIGERTRNPYYDKAAELLKKFQMNEFTGEDNHE